MGYQSFRELRVWQEAKSLAVAIYRLSSSARLAHDFGLKDQMQRAAVSIPSNIAEGYERKSNPEFIRYLLIAKGSLSELTTQLEIAREVGLIEEPSFFPLEHQCNKLSAMLTKLIHSRSSNLSSIRKLGFAPGYAGASTTSPINALPASVGLINNRSSQIRAMTLLSQ